MPKKIPFEYYEEVIGFYIDDVKDYVHSIYSVGNISYPGLSDIDLVVIPKEKYLSSFRLEMKGRYNKKYNNIIHHNPFVIPDEFKSLWKYTLLSNMKVIYGDNQLIEVDKDNSYTNKFCHAIEGLLSYLEFSKHTSKGQFLNASYAIPVFSSFRFTISLFQDLKFITENNYAVEFDELRNKILESNNQNVVIEMYTIFEENLELLTKNICEQLQLKTINLKEINNFYLHDRKFIDREIFIKRNGLISKYNEYLKKHNYHYGHMFRTAYFPTPTISYHYRILRKLMVLTNFLK